MTARRAPRHPDERLVHAAAVRTGALAALGAAAIVLVLAAGAMLVTLHGQRHAAAALLNEAVATADDTEDPPAGMWLVIQRWDQPDRLQTSPGLPPGLPVRAVLEQVRRTRQTDSQDVTIGREHYRVRTGPGRPGVVQAILNLRADRFQTASMLGSLAALGALGLVLAGLGGTWMGKRAVRPLVAALSLQRRFVADASHELRTPVTLLSTRAQLLRRGLHGGRAGPHAMAEADRLVAEAGQLAAILDDLLLTADQQRQPRLAVDLVALATDVTDAAAVEATGVTVCGPTTGHAVVLGSPVALRRALTALVDNAVRHATSAARVDIRLTAGMVVVDVTDDGPGIDPAVENRLFDRFATAPPAQETHTTTRPEPRSRYGIGLALVSEIAARHRGTLASVGTPGNGATLRLSLPSAPP